jgi:hyperosmotically inducible protein
MKLKSTVAFVLAASLLAPMISQADQDTNSDRSHPINFVKDSAITTAIKTKLAAEHLKSLEHIRVDTDRDGVVWLSGFAFTRHEADRAEAVARDTDGVRAVRNDISVKAGS